MMMIEFVGKDNAPKREYMYKYVTAVIAMIALEGGAVGRRPHLFLPRDNRYFVDYKLYLWKVRRRTDVGTSNKHIRSRARGME